MESYSSLPDEIKDRILWGYGSEERISRRYYFKKDMGMGELVTGTLGIANGYFPDIYLKSLYRLAFKASLNFPDIGRGSINFYNTKLSDILETINSKSVTHVNISEKSNTLESHMILSEGTPEDYNLLVIGRGKYGGPLSKFLFDSRLHVDLIMNPDNEEKRETLLKISADVENRFKDYLLGE